MRLNIHIGLHKSGSTALQKGLFSARDALATAGVIYPKGHIIWDAHHMLPWALLGGKRALFDGTPAEDIVAAWRREAAEHNAELMVISSEDFEFLDPRHIRWLHAQFEDCAPDIYVYLRPQDEYLIAEYKQHVRMFDTAFAGPIEQFYYRFPLNGRFNYFQRANLWAQAFGREHVHLTVYNRRSLVNNDIVADFAQWTRLPETTAGYRGDDENVSLSNLTTVIMSRINRLGMTADSRGRLMNRLDVVVAKEGLDVELLDSAARKALTDCFRESNRKLLAEFPMRGDTSCLLQARSSENGRRDYSEQVIEALLHLVKDDASKP